MSKTITLEIPHVVLVSMHPDDGEGEFAIFEDGSLTGRATYSPEVGFTFVSQAEINESHSGGYNNAPWERLRVGYRNVNDFLHDIGIVLAIGKLLKDSPEPEQDRWEKDNPREDQDT